LIEFISGFGLTAGQWLLVMLAAALVGANKTGIVGISLVSIPILAAVFGGKASTGVILPMLVIADIFAVVSYRKSIRWRELLGLIPWTLAGIVIALFVGRQVSDSIFKICIATVIFMVLIFMIFQEVRGSCLRVEARWYVDAAVGVLGGFATMIGNAAGPIIAVYFLSRNLGKNEFIATRAWFFWIVNILKIPLHLFVWKTVTAHTLGFDLLLLPAIAAGAAAGILFVKRIPERPYRWFLIGITAVSSIFLII